MIRTDKGAFQGLPAALDREEQDKLLLQYAATKDEKAREKLINHNLKLVALVVERMFSDKPWFEKEDLFSVGSIGLMQAVEAFDPAKGVRFSSYAVLCVRNEILRYLKVNLLHSKPVESLDEVVYVEGRETPLVETLTDGEDFVSDKVDELYRKELMKVVNAFLNTLEPEKQEVLEEYWGINGKKKKSSTQISMERGVCRNAIIERSNRAKKKILAIFSEEVQRRLETGIDIL